MLMRRGLADEGSEENWDNSGFAFLMLIFIQTVYGKMFFALLSVERRR